jgi:peptide-methionine (S)-S-oxide reductase
MPGTEAASSLDARFRDAVSAIDSGDAATLEQLIADNPALARERLDAPGAWLRDVVGKAVDGFFHRPYLLWFVAEDPVRNGRLPGNIAEMARVIIDAARGEGASNLQEQLDYALMLVSWSWIARQCDVQIQLIDVLIDAGANPDGNPNNALVNGNVAAAEHLVERGATLTLATALCLGRWDDVDRLVATANNQQRQFALVLSALNGRAEALRRMIKAGADLDAPSADLYSHGTPLHHAVGSGSLDAVKVLVEAGANTTTRDKAWDGTPLGWAEHYINEMKSGGATKEYAAIAKYLRERSVKPGGRAVRTDQT